MCDKNLEEKLLLTCPDCTYSQLCQRAHLFTFFFLQLFVWWCALKYFIKYLKYYKIFNKNFRKEICSFQKYLISCCLRHLGDNF